MRIAGDACRRTKVNRIDQDIQYSTRWIDRIAYFSHNTLIKLINSKIKRIPSTVWYYNRDCIEIPHRDCIPRCPIRAFCSQDFTHFAISCAFSSTLELKNAIWLLFLNQVCYISADNTARAFYSSIRLSFSSNIIINVEIIVFLGEGGNKKYCTWALTSDGAETTMEIV